MGHAKRPHSMADGRCLGRTSFSKALNSSSFFCLYSSISFWASLRASFTRLVRSVRCGQIRFVVVVNESGGGGAELPYILWLRNVSFILTGDGDLDANLSAQSSAPHARPVCWCELGVVDMDPHSG